MNLLMPLLYLLLAFTLLFIIADLMDNASDFLESGAAPMMMLKYYSLQLPSLVAVIGFFVGGLAVTHFLLPLLLGGGA